MNEIPDTLKVHHRALIAALPAQLTNKRKESEPFEMYIDFYYNYL